MLFQQLLLDNANRTPEAMAFHWVDRDKTLSFADAAEQMDACAGFLHHLGVNPGDRVSIFAHNGMDYLIAMFGTWRLGAISALVNVAYKDELDHFYGDHTPSVIIYTHDMEQEVKAAAARLDPVPRLVCMDGAQDGAFSMIELMEARMPAPADPWNENAIAHLSYTSGTTGRPKGACLMHEPTMCATNCIAERLRIKSGDVSFGPTALSSSYQLVGNIMAPLHRGAGLNVMRFWTPEDGYDAIERRQATMFVGNPTNIGHILDVSRQRRKLPGRLRFVMSGGAPMPPTTKQGLRDDFRLPVAESYGQSELGGFVGLGEPVLMPDDKLAPVGRPLPDKDVRILDSQGQERPDGQVGEVCIRGGYMWGYWGKPEETAKATTGGFLHTGDAGLRTADGFVEMRGRFSELFEVNGELWFPRDVEEALCRRPNIVEASVLGVERGGEMTPVAFVRSDLPLAPNLAEQIAPEVSYDLSRLEIVLVDAFPMTPTGKISKAQLRDSLTL